jgi:hypothetical protein
MLFITNKVLWAFKKCIHLEATVPVAPAIITLLRPIYLGPNNVMIIDHWIQINQINNIL